MRTIFFILSSLLINHSLLAQTSFNANDLDGVWGRADGIRIEIKGSQAVLLSVGNSKWPAKAEGGLRFTRIKYIGEGKWEALNRSWRYPGTDPQEGRWHDYGLTTLVLSADKNTLNGGNSSFTREKKITGAAKETEPDGKTFLEVNYDGIKVKYTIAHTTGGNMYVVAQASNTHKKLEALLTFTGTDGSIVKQTIAPNSVYTQKLNVADFHVQVSFKAYRDASGPDVIEYIKKIVKDRVTVKDRKVKNSYTGVRG